MDEVVGTEGFVPPEVVDQDCTGPAMDLWGLGIITCLCMKGKYVHYTSQILTSDWSRKKSWFVIGQEKNPGL